MPYDPLTDEQREIRDLVRDLARERIAPRAAEIDKKGEFPWDVVELFREHELFGLPYDEAYGGTGTGALMVLVAIEELSKVCATTGLILAVQELAHGDDGQADPPRFEVQLPTDSSGTGASPGTATRARWAVTEWTTIVYCWRSSSASANT